MQLCLHWSALIPVAGQTQFLAKVVIAVAGVGSSRDGRHEQEAVQDQLRHHEDGAPGLTAQKCTIMRRMRLFRTIWGSAKMEDSMPNNCE